MAARSVGSGRDPSRQPLTGSRLAPELLEYRPPFDWSALLAWLEPRATPGLEVVAAGSYGRSVRVGRYRGRVEVSQAGNVPALRLDCSPSLSAVAADLRSRIRNLFDLDADPVLALRHLARDSWLAPLLERRPGLRIPGAFDGFELAVRAVLGQQVSVRGASTLAGRLVALLGEFSAERLAQVDETRIASIGLPRARARTLAALARAATIAGIELSPGADPEHTRRALMEVPGIGEWTVEYVLMRAVRWPDAFPAGDLGPRKAAGGLSAAALRDRAERWRPWRALAAQHLWQSLSDGSR